MPKFYKKRIAVAICILVILVSNSVPALATVKYSNLDVISSNAQIIATITITDPETGRVWQWNVPNSDIRIQSVTASLNSETEKIAVVSVNLGKYLAASYKDISTTLNDDITLTTGLSYSENVTNNTISISSVFGSTIPRGLYYATNRTVWWRNPGAGLGGTLHPTTNSWYYPTDTTPGFYSSQMPPYSMVECDVYVSGMEPIHRTISVKCSVNL